MGKRKYPGFRYKLRANRECDVMMDLEAVDKSGSSSDALQEQNASMIQGAFVSARLYAGDYSAYLEYAGECYYESPEELYKYIKIALHADVPGSHGHMARHCYLNFEDKLEEAIEAGLRGEQLLGDLYGAYYAALSMIKLGRKEDGLAKLRDLAGRGFTPAADHLTKNYGGGPSAKLSQMPAWVQIAVGGLSKKFMAAPVTHLAWFFAALLTGYIHPLLPWLGWTVLFLLKRTLCRKPSKIRLDEEKGRECFAESLDLRPWSSEYATDPDMGYVDPYRTLQAPPIWDYRPKFESPEAVAECFQRLDADMTVWFRAKTAAQLRETRKQHLIARYQGGEKTEKVINALRDLYGIEIDEGGNPREVAWSFVNPYSNMPKG